LIDYLIDSRHSPWPGRQSHTAHLLLVVPSSESHCITVHTPFLIVVPSVHRLNNQSPFPRYYRGITVSLSSLSFMAAAAERSRRSGPKVAVWRRLNSPRWIRHGERWSWTGLHPSNELTQVALIRTEQQQLQSKCF